MENTTLTGTAPLTRRQAREIERRTGVRPVVSLAPSYGSKDTGEIERNEMDALVSVLPTELVDRVAAPIAHDEVEIPAAFDARGLTIRAARPAALVAQRRRRVAGGFAAAASVTALAAAGLTTIGGQGVEVAAADHQANLLSATTPDSTDLPTEAEESAEVAAPAPIEVDANSTSIQSFDASVVQAAATEVVVEAPVEETVPSESSDSDYSDSSSSESTGSGSSSSSSNSGSSSSTTASYSAPSAVGSSIAETAKSWVGQGMYGHGTTPAAWDCSGFILYVHAQHGISLPWGVSSQVAMGSVVSDPQPGDLVIFGNGYHAGIYIGGGQMVHSPDYGRSIEVGGISWDSHYFVRL